MSSKSTNNVCQIQPEELNPFGVWSRMFQENQVNTMATDALAPCIARSLAAMLLTFTG